MEALFQECIESIAQAHHELGFRQGWRFLFSPKDTLSSDTDLMLVGINPAQPNCIPPTSSCEAGNMFRLDKDTTSDRYRTGVQDIFRGFATAIDDPDGWLSIMDQTLTSNFCPFPSSRWSDFRRHDDLLDFCHRLWVRICSHLKPPTTLCLGSPAYRCFTSVYDDLGFESIEEESFPAGWGKLTVSHRVMRRDDQTIHLLRVPHPSRFRIIGSPVPDRQAASRWLLTRMRMACER